MTVPKRKHTKSKRDKRRMHLYIKVAGVSRCPKCGQAVLGHTVCANCGYYKGREVINVLEKLTKKEKKIREKEIARKEKETGKKMEPTTIEELPEESK